MKTTAFLHSVRRPVALLACASLAGLASLLAADPKEPAYENSIELGGGYTLQSGDRAGFQKAFQIKKDGFIGIESLRYTSQLDDTTYLKLLGKAMAGNNDFLFDLTITRDEVGYVKAGYRAFRTFYDGSGGVWPLTGLSFKLYDEDLAVDRSNLWFEIGLARPDNPSLTFRYDLLTREGEKDSTSWMDTGIPLGSANTRYIIPTFLKFDEKRHILKGTLARKGEKAGWEIGFRMDKGDYDNGRYSRRRAFEPTADRYVTAKEGQDYDMQQFRGLYVVDLTDKIKVTTSAARTKIDTELTGSRIFGMGYDATFSTTYPTRQQRDEGFFALPGHANIGESEMTQTVANISVLYRPLEHLAIIPSARFERTEWTNEIEVEETNFGGAPTFAPILGELMAESEKHWKTWSYGVEARYTGIANFTFNVRGDVSKSDGELDETRILEPGTPLQVISVQRASALARDTQKVSFTTNWYPQPGLAVSAQYYFKARQNDFDAITDTTPNTITSSDRYPAYIKNQDLETNDFNVRVSWRVTPTFRTVTRYDYMKSKIMNQDVGLPFGPAMDSEQTIISESITWNPLARLYVQGNISLVKDTLTTPAVFATGTAANLVTASNADYVNYGLSAGYALDERSDLFLDYVVFESRDSFINNAPTSTPYGTQLETSAASAAWTCRLDRRTAVSVKYTYAKGEDPVLVGKGDYEANIVQAKLKYRF